MNEVWLGIRDDYHKAKAALWGRKGIGCWSRDEETGRYYMWKAYHAARTAEPKDELLYARILWMMADESRTEPSTYDRYHKYVKPSLAAYERAISEGQAPTEKELEMVRWAEASMAYELGAGDVPYEEQISLIKGHEKLGDFQFHDSRPIRFEQAGETATLRLRFQDSIATFAFAGVTQLDICTDPTDNWIFDFQCYRTPQGGSLVTFDVESYRITCEEVTLVSVEEATA